MLIQREKCISLQKCEEGRSFTSVLLKRRNAQVITLLRLNLGLRADPALRSKCELLSSIYTSHYNDYITFGKETTRDSIVKLRILDCTNAHAYDLRWAQKYRATLAGWLGLTQGQVSRTQVRLRSTLATAFKRTRTRSSQLNSKRNRRRCIDKDDPRKADKHSEPTCGSIQ